MFASIDTLSGSGSRVAGGDLRRRQRSIAKRRKRSGSSCKAKRAARGEDTSFNPFDLWFDDEGRPDSADWFAAHGWTTRTVSAREEACAWAGRRSPRTRRFANSFVTAAKS